MRVLLMGEPRRGGYIWAVLKHSGVEVVHSPVDAGPGDRPDISGGEYDVIVIREGYSAIGYGVAVKLRDAVERGTGLLMTGGWSTFTGRNIEGVFSGGYRGTLIEEALPVSLLDRDDRVNETLYLVVSDRVGYRRIFGDDMPDYDKAVCGCNEVVPKKGSTTVLEGVKALYHDGRVDFSTRYPILVTGAYGRGRTAAYTSDLSPHWAGNIVDWQRDETDRSALPLGFEVGNLYIRFCMRLISWLAPQR